MTRLKIPQPLRGLYQVDNSVSYVLKVSHRGDSQKAMYAGPRDVHSVFFAARKKNVGLKRGVDYDNYLERKGRFILPKELVHAGEPS